MRFHWSKRTFLISSLQILPSVIWEFSHFAFASVRKVRRLRCCAQNSSDAANRILD